MKRTAYILSLAAAAATTLAADWTQWRGPNFNGYTDEKGLPAEFTRESAQ